MSVSPRTFLLFDVDGTLVESIALDDECFPSAVAEHLGIDAVAPDWSGYRNTTDPGIFLEICETHLGRHPTLPELTSFKERYVGKLRDLIGADESRCRPIAGAANFLDSLRNRAGFGFGIATGAWREAALVKLAAAGIDIAGAPFASGNDAIERSSIFAAALQRSAQSFDRVVLIGDAVWDMLTARKLGVEFLGVGRGERANRLRSAGATDIIEDFRDIPSLLHRLGRARP